MGKYNQVTTMLRGFYKGIVVGSVLVLSEMFLPGWYEDENRLKLGPSRAVHDIEQTQLIKL